jgi:hypothetical protein
VREGWGAFAPRFQHGRGREGMPPRLQLRSHGGEGREKSKIAAQVAEGVKHDETAGRAAGLLIGCGGLPPTSRRLAMTMEFLH